MHPDQTMKKTVTLLLSLLLFPALTTLRAEPISPKELLQKHYQAIGGQDNHRKLTSRLLRGSLDVPAQGFSATILIRNKAPNKIRTEIEITGIGKFADGFDGQSAWAHNPFSGVSDQPPRQEAMTRRQADFYRAVELYDRYDQWTLKEPGTVDNQPVYRLEASKDGQTDMVYLDQKTFLITQVITSLNGTKTTARFRDYREIDGVTLPFHIEIDSMETGKLSIKLEEISHPADFDDALFAKPGN
jgi:hypothetical protein